MRPIVKRRRRALPGLPDKCSNLKMTPDGCQVTPVEDFGCFNRRICLNFLVGLPIAVMPLLAQSHPIRDHTLTMMEL